MVRGAVWRPGPASATLAAVLRPRVVYSVVCAAIVSLVATLVVPPSTTADTDETCQRSRRRRRSRGPRLTSAERRAIKRRHTKAPRRAIDSWLEGTPPSLVLRPVNGGGEYELTPDTDDGGFQPDDLLVAETALASSDGSTHPIHPRLLDLVYQAARHFRAPWVYVISGYRDDRATSRHSHGRAMDFVLPGTTDRRLAAWVRRFGFVGVGIYPTSGFVHLDVRERSYFWSDSSGPREDNRERPILRDEATRYDRAARRDGVEPTSDDVIDEARAAERAARAAAAEEGDEDAEGGGEGEGEAAVVEGEEPLEDAEPDEPVAAPTVEVLPELSPDAGLIDAP